MGLCASESMASFYPVVSFSQVTQDLTAKIWLWPHYSLDSLYFEHININIARLTGGPWKYPEIYSCPFPEHTACHHEAHRRAASILTATDSGIACGNVCIYIVSCLLTSLKFMSHRLSAFLVTFVLACGSHFFLSSMYSSVFWWPNSGVTRYCLTCDVFHTPSCHCHE